LTCQRNTVQANASKHGPVLARTKKFSKPIEDMERLANDYQ